MTAKPHRSRKFILACSSILLATGLLLAGFVDGANWVDVTKWVTGLFMAGNVGEKYASKTEAKP